MVKTALEEMFDKLGRVALTPEIARWIQHHKHILLEIEKSQIITAFYAGYTNLDDDDSYKRAVEYYDIRYGKNRGN